MHSTAAALEAAGLSNVDRVQSLLAQRRRGPPRKREQKVNEENNGGKELPNEPHRIRGLRMPLPKLWLILVTVRHRLLRSE